MKRRYACTLLGLVLCSAVLTGCQQPEATSAAQLGIATPGHPVTDPARLESPPGTPMELPVPTPAVPRATDAGANDEGGAIEPE